jgi:hypothetical protein
LVHTASRNSEARCTRALGAACVDKQVDPHHCGVGMRESTCPAELE